MIDALAGEVGKMVQQQVATHDPSHQMLHWIIRIVPGGAATVLLVLGWAFRKKLELWIRRVIKKEKAQ